MYKFFLPFLLLIYSTIQSQALYPQEPRVRVQIINTDKEIKIRFNSDWRLLNGFADLKVNHQSDFYHISVDSNKVILKNSDNKTLASSDSLVFKCDRDTGTVKIFDVAYGVGWWWEGQEDRTYEGEISIYKSGKSLQAVIKLSLEQYLKGVVPYEIGNDSPLEALKAQAIAARSEAVMALNSEMYSGKHHDLTSDVECQVFSGNNKRNSASDLAVEETRGLIISESSKPINAYYASNCGGHSELIKNVWPERPDPSTYKIAGKDGKQRINLDLQKEDVINNWIESKPNVFCNPNLETELPSWSQKNFRWTRKYSIDTISKMIAAEKDLGKLLEIKALKRGPSGRMYRARFIFEKGSFDITGELAIRQQWHPSLRSSCFVVLKDSTNFILKGAGWGHGVGMCQSGAVAMAKNGKSFQKIIQHYYPGTELIHAY